jgi:hypothetical protein
MRNTKFLGTPTGYGKNIDEERGMRLNIKS